MDNLREVVRVFEEMFGEERVELQRWNGDEQADREDSISYIMVFFPEVTITNEKDESHLIRELWVRVPINDSGSMLGKFTITRTCLTDSEYNLGYFHSHANVRGYKECCLKFHNVCLGGTPLKDLCTTLNNNSDPTLWRMFCFELNRFVRTESLKGVPYIKLSSISKHGGVIEEFTTLKIPGLFISEVVVTNTNILIAKEFFNKIKDTLIFDDGIIRISELYNNEGLKRLNLILANIISTHDNPSLSKYLCSAFINDKGVLCLCKGLSELETPSGSIFFKGKSYPLTYIQGEIAHIYGVKSNYFYFIIGIGLHILNLNYYETSNTKFILPHPTV